MDNVSRVWLFPLPWSPLKSYAGSDRTLCHILHDQSSVCLYDAGCKNMQDSVILQLQLQCLNPTLVD